jgi:isopentenyldiphosphate isomerase
MRIKELLLELREVLDRTYYGAWIDANTRQSHPIDKQGGHIDFIKTKLHEWGIPEEYLQNTTQYYMVGYAHGWVRAQFRPIDDAQFEGMASDLRKIGRIILATAVQPDVRVIRVTKFTDLEDTSHTNFKTFTVPSEIPELKAYLGLH